MGGKWYAVARGRQTGLFTTWPECEKQVKGFSGARYKSFKTEGEAQEFLRNPGGPPGAKKAEGMSMQRQDESAEREAKRRKTANGAKAADLFSMGVPPPTDGLDDPTTAAVSAEQQRSEGGGVGAAADGGARFMMKFDGGSRGNPGPAGAGAVIWDPTGQKIWWGWWWLGSTTNNQAEATGMLRGLKQAQEIGVTELEVLGDSKLLINQVNGTWRVHNPGLVPLVAECRHLRSGFDFCRFRHVYRKDNKEADAAANRAMDSRSDGEEYLES